MGEVFDMPFYLFYNMLEALDDEEDRLEEAQRRSDWMDQQRLLRMNQ